jgi:hypothetical protein
VSAGIKIADPRGMHLVTKQPLMMRTDTWDEQFLVQSFELCALLIIADAHDTKAFYEDVLKISISVGRKFVLKLCQQ